MNTTERWREGGAGFAGSNRLAEISKRQMARAMSLPASATPEEESIAMETAHEGKNGVSKHKPGAHYSPEFKEDIVRRFEAAEHKRAFAAEAGLATTMLQRWLRESRAGKDWRVRYPNKPGKTGPAPAKPDKTRKPRAARPAGDVDFARELDVLRQLLELPADARDRIVAYLAARGRG